MKQSLKRRRWLTISETVAVSDALNSGDGRVDVDGNRKKTTYFSQHVPYHARKVGITSAGQLRLLSARLKVLRRCQSQLDARGRWTRIRPQDHVGAVETSCSRRPIARVHMR